MTGLPPSIPSWLCSCLLDLPTSTMFVCVCAGSHHLLALSLAFFRCGISTQFHCWSSIVMTILSPLIMNNALCLFNLAMEHDLFYLQYAQKNDLWWFAYYKWIEMVIFHGYLQQPQAFPASRPVHRGWSSGPGENQGILMGPRWSMDLPMKNGWFSIVFRVSISIYVPDATHGTFTHKYHKNGSFWG